MTYRRYTDRRLAVLLVTNDLAERRRLAIVGDAKPRVSDSEGTDYAELLSAYNYRFDVVRPEDIHRRLLVDTGSISYSSIILAVPLSTLTESTLSLMREVSHDAGVSLITAYDHPEQRSAAFFGIEQFVGRRMLWPLKVRIIQWPHESAGGTCVADYGLKSGLPGARRRGLRRLSWKPTLAKALSLISSLRLPYMRANCAHGAKILATTMQGVPVAWSYRFGHATNYYFALHGDSFLDKYNEMHFMVRSAIEANSGYGMVSADLDKTMVLRLDDPGASRADYVQDGQILNESDWNQLGRVLREKGIPLSVMYTPGWMDDGDARSGRLFIDDELVTDRAVGAMHESARVKYVFLDHKRSDHDHVSEFRGLATLVNDNLVDVHSHGLTHLVPDYEAWAASEDKNKGKGWYTEFVHRGSNEPVDKDVQMHAMVSSKCRIAVLFNATPSAIAPSGHKHDSECDVLAHHAGYKLFSSDYTGILKAKLLIRNWKIAAVCVFLKEPSSVISKAGYPVIGIVHDYEIKGRLDGFVNIVEKWSANGIKRFTSLRNLTASLCSSIDAHYSVEDSRMNVDIAFDADVKADGRDKSGDGTEIVVRVVVPAQSSCDKERITLDGGLLLSVEQSTQSTLSLLIRVIDTKLLRIIIPTHPVCWQHVTTGVA